MFENWNQGWSTVLRRTTFVSALFVLSSFALPVPGWPAISDARPAVSEDSAKPAAGAGEEKSKRRITILNDEEFRRIMHMPSPEEILSPAEQKDLQRLVKQRPGSATQGRCHIIACVATNDGCTCWYHCV
ncbi:MAG TPA: hypothetical protein VGH73_10020 [Thermoanaerobaculia bacterium]|jgi:hypothetical protein